MQIISSRKLLFEKTNYTETEDGTIVAHVEARVLVQPHHLPQEVADWVKDTEHYALCEQDGTVLEVVYKNRNSNKPVRAMGVSNSPKVIDNGVQTQVAKIVGQDTEPKQAQETGWGAPSGLTGN